MDLICYLLVWAYILRNLCLVSTITKRKSWNWKFLRYILPEISYWMCYVVRPWFSKSKVEVTILIYLFEFRDIDLVLIDTKHTFLRYITTRDISFWMSYVLFDLECQSQKSRSRYWYNYIFLIPRHWFSTYRHQTQVPTMYTTKDIILNASSCLTLHFKGQKSRFKILIYIFVNSATSIQYLLTLNTNYFYDIYYHRYHIECVTSCLTLNFKVKGQGHDIDI